MDSSVKLTIESIPTVNILSSPLYTDDLTQEFIVFVPWSYLLYFPTLSFQK